jgi:hypothetical protein
MISIQNYNEKRGIYSPLIEHNGIICGFWMVGNDYHNKKTFYGTYPPNYLKRMKILFPSNKKLLHLFSGVVDKSNIGDYETTLDINPDLNPDYCGNAENLSSIISTTTFDLILADPPYNNNHLKYGTTKVNKKKVIHECSLITETGGHLVWLDTIMPIWAKKDGWKLRGTIGLLQSTNHAVRVITILEKTEIS